MNLLRSGLLSVFLACAALTLGSGLALAEPCKILVVNSYSSDWDWIKDQVGGFRESLSGVECTFKTVDLNVKTGTPETIKSLADSAVKIVGDWKPDLVYTTDDHAQTEITAKFLNTPMPIVYSGVNKEHADYGFDQAANVTGVLEREHFLGSVRLLREICSLKHVRLAIVIDDDPTWDGVIKRINAELPRDNDLEVVAWLQPKTFDEFKTSVARLQGKVDAIGMIGVFRFKDVAGNFVDYEQVLRWTAENSPVPDFSFWDTRVERGTLCSMTVSGIEQGRLAGSMARRILLDKVPPSAIPPEQTSKGRPMLSLARAKQLNIHIKADVLLNSVVLKKYAWDD